MTEYKHRATAYPHGKRRWYIEIGCQEVTDESLPPLAVLADAATIYGSEDRAARKAERMIQRHVRTHERHAFTVSAETA